ncbi:peptidase E [Nocardioides sp. KR10-350]|uniref:Type 1 glutamine amidotransferase-like domain-containing protein n=1 Tax=Nocardioides cheoyonin TaxID=3156615 RepID=UPI0032B3E534
MAPGTFLTLGGGGFSMIADGEDLAASPLDAFLLSLTGKDRPRVCFVPTASGDSPTYIDRFLRAFRDRAEATVLPLFNNERDAEWAIPVEEVERVLDQDVVYVGGGSTANLLAVWRLHGLDELLARAAAGGTVMAGISAGMNCWYEASSTDSFGPLAPLTDGLGLLPGSCCPHYFGEPGRQAAYTSWVAGGGLPEGVAADDHAALLWRDGELVEAVTERAGGRAFRVTRVGGRAVETPLEVRELG